MKTFRFISVLVILVLVVGLTGCPTKPPVVSTSGQNETKSPRESRFEERFSAKWPRTDDERELLRPVVVGKMCEAWNELVGPRQRLNELKAQAKESSDKLTPLTPEDIIQRVKLNKQVEKLEGDYSSLRYSYHLLVQSAWDAGFQEVWVMPDNGLPSGGC
jgi:hypothetical protein